MLLVLSLVGCEVEPPAFLPGGQRNAQGTSGNAWDTGAETDTGSDTGTSADGPIFSDAVEAFWDEDGLGLRVQDAYTDDPDDLMGGELFVSYTPEGGDVVLVDMAILGEETRVDGVDAYAAGGEIFFLLSGLDDGLAHTIEFYANDEAGNASNTVAGAVDPAS